MTGTLGDMVTACRLELDYRTDLDTEIRNAISAAIAHYQNRKFWFSEGIETGSTVANQPSLPVPADFGYIDGITIKYTTYHVVMERRDWRTMQEMMVAQQVLKGPPTDYAIYRNEIYFWPVPILAYEIKLYKNRQMAAPASDTETGNYWMTEAEEIIRSRAVQDVKVHNLRQMVAITEFAQAAPAGFFGGREKIAYDTLHDFTVRRIASGRIKPIAF